MIFSTSLPFREEVSVDLFGSKPLNIFNAKTTEENLPVSSGSPLSVWDVAHQRELKMSMSRQPANAFVEMIQWTKQGKVWTFPIDNEVG